MKQDEQNGSLVLLTSDVFQELWFIACGIVWWTPS